jgi:citronellol/citronellal dehydrogenase
MGYSSIFRPGLFDGQTIVVTGGGSGIGRCTAHELASLGAHVVLIGRDRVKLERVEAEISQDGGQASCYVMDIRDEATVIGVIDEILHVRGAIDGLVNNAGGQYRAKLSTISTKGFEAVVRTNLTGGFIVMREVYNRCMSERGGAIVNMIADISNGWPYFAHSGASRGGMLTLTESAASEWAASNVHVNCVAPGAIASSGLDTYDAEHTAYIQNEIAREIPLQRFGVEAEVAAAIVFLLSPAAAFITGSCIRIDGGAPNARKVWGPLEPSNRSTPFRGFHRAAAPQILKSEGSE